MKNQLQLVLAAGALAGLCAIAGCQQDRPGGATGPGRAPEAARVNPDPGLVPFGDASGPLTFTDAEGHRYEVVFGVDANGTVNVVRHSRDGVPFAEIRPAAGGEDVAYLEDGAIVQDQFLAQTDGLPSQPIVKPGVQTGNPGDPLQMMFPCEDAIQAYILASGELIAAGMYLQRNRGSRRALVIFAGAVANWVGAWSTLYNCMGA
jgi:hypothetical protein